MSNNFGKQLKQIILDAGLSQKKLAETLNVSQQMLSDWIRGRRKPKLETLKKMSLATGHPLSYFVGGDSIVSSGNNNVIGNRNSGVIQSIGSAEEVSLLKKEIELLRRELEVERREKELLLKSKKKRG